MGKFEDLFTVIVVITAFLGFVFDGVYFIYLSLTNGPIKEMVTSGIFMLFFYQALYNNLENKNKGE